MRYHKTCWSDNRNPRAVKTLQHPQNKQHMNLCSHAECTQQKAEKIHMLKTQGPGLGEAFPHAGLTTTTPTGWNPRQENSTSRRPTTSVLIPTGCGVTEMTSLPWHHIRVQILLKPGVNSAGGLVTFTDKTANLVMTALDATTRSAVIDSKFDSIHVHTMYYSCLLYTSPSPRDS